MDGIVSLTQSLTHHAGMSSVIDEKYKVILAVSAASAALALYFCLRFVDISDVCVSDGETIIQR